MSTTTAAAPMSDAVPWLTGFAGPSFFETPLGATLIVTFVVGLVTLRSIAAHRWWMTDTTLMLWISVVMLGGPFGVAAWFAWGKPAVRRYRDDGNSAVESPV